MNTEQEWISVEDRLPEPGECSCFVCLDEFEEEVELDFVHSNWGNGNFVDSDNRIICDITHWKPKPKQHEYR